MADFANATCRFDQFQILLVRDAELLFQIAVGPNATLFFGCFLLWNDGIKLFAVTLLASRR
jgi:hypothetical protein